MYESCSPRRIDEIIRGVFDPALNPHGFLRSTPRKYVRKRIEYTHDVIELLSQKISLRMIWGVSLDFVPHVAGRATETVQWHRTARSANPDLRYSESENASQPMRRFDISTIQGEDLMQKQAQSTLAGMVPRALKFLDSVPNLLAIERLFVHEVQHPQWGDLYNTPQIALAYAFYLAQMGKEENARVCMAGWLKRSHRRPETNQRLRELFEDAVRRPLYGQSTTG